VAHDGAVGEEEERLGDKRGEGGQGEPDDLPVMASGIASGIASGVTSGIASAGVESLWHSLRVIIHM
jgi:hypothetical protein